MMIKLMDTSRNPFWIRADAIRSIERSNENPLVTVVVQNLITPQGPACIGVLDNMDDIAAAINRALGGDKAFH